MCIDLIIIINELSAFHKKPCKLNFNGKCSRYGDYHYTLLKYNNSTRFICRDKDINTIFDLSIFFDVNNTDPCSVQTLSNVKYLNIYNNFNSTDIQSKFNLSFPICEEEYNQMQFSLCTYGWIGYSTLVKSRDLNLQYDLSLLINNTLTHNELLFSLNNLVETYYD